jgi:bifunctional non-homologous end joining protein LigD
VAKRLDSAYESGQRSGAWQKMRTNRSQEFEIGGYTPGGRNFDALIFGHYEGERLVHVARTRNGLRSRWSEGRRAQNTSMRVRLCRQVD